MKNTYKFVLIMVVLFCLSFVLQLQMPKKFVWNPTYHHADAQPFGCYVFDSVLSQSMPEGYHVTKKTFRQLDEEHRGKQISVLVVATKPLLAKTDVAHLKKLAKRGGKVMVVSDYLDDDLLGVDFEQYSYFSINYLQRSLRANKNVYDTICWHKQDSVFTDRQYRVFGELITSCLVVDSVQKAKIWAAWENGTVIRPVAVSVPYGKGEVFFVSTPLLFTNYGILDKQANLYVFRLMSQLNNLPVYRTEAYMQTDAMREARQSPLREFLKRPALRWAIYLALLGVVLFMVFTARRRQRVIPVMQKPKNHSLEFIQLIGTLYYQRKDHADLVRKKFRYFAEEVRRKAGVDIADVNGDDSEFRLLADKTGMKEDYLRQVIRDIRLVVHSDSNIPSAQMRELVDAMNEIVDKL